MATVNPLLQQIDAIAKEKGVEPDIIITALQDAHRSRRAQAIQDRSAARPVQPGDRQLELYAVKKIVDEVTDASTQISLSEAQQLYGDEAEVDMEIEFPRPTEDLGRIAAQTAKQVIFQKVREAERENVYAEYSQRVGEVVSGTVKRFENGDIIIELGRIESQLPRKEQSRAENYTVGDRVRAVIRGVNRSAKGPQIVLSRTDPALLIKLFEQEVPEIYDGTVDDPRRRPRGRRSRQGGGLLARARRRSGRRLRRHEGHARPVDHPRAARREDRHRRVVGGSDPLRDQRDQPGQGPAGLDRGRRRAGDGSDRRGQAAVAGDRQEGPERPAGGQADRLEDRHQERGREAPRSRGAARRARDWRDAGDERRPRTRTSRAGARRQTADVESRVETAPRRRARADAEQPSAGGAEQSEAAPASEAARGQPNGADERRVKSRNRLERRSLRTLTY